MDGIYMKNISFTISVSALFLSITVNINAATIIDTDVIQCDGNGCEGRILSYASNYPDSKYAARFSLESNTTITKLDAWINTEGNIGRTFTMVLYQDIYINTSRTGKVIYSQDVTINDTGLGDNFDNQWQGLSNLELNLSSGSYWLSLEIHENDNYDGYVPTSPYGALYIAEPYAVYFPVGAGDVWRERSNYNFAFRISDNTPVIVADGDLAPLGNPDGIINAADYLIAMRIALGDIDATSLELAHGDIYPSGSPDGVIDLSDVVLILNKIF